MHKGHHHWLDKEVDKKNMGSWQADSELWIIQKCSSSVHYETEWALCPQKHHVCDFERQQTMEWMTVNCETGHQTQIVFWGSCCQVYVWQQILWGKNNVRVLVNIADSCSHDIAVVQPHESNNWVWKKLFWSLCSSAFWTTGFEDLAWAAMFFHETDWQTPPGTQGPLPNMSGVFCLWRMQCQFCRTLQGSFLTYHSSTNSVVVLIW